MTIDTIKTLPFDESKVREIIRQYPTPFYLYDEKGTVHLVDPAGGGLKEVSTFKVSRGTKEHFSHPVIGNGVLYIRHGKSLMAYNIKQA